MNPALSLVSVNTSLHCPSYNTASSSDLCYTYPGMEQSISASFEPNDIAYRYRTFTRIIFQDSAVINVVLKKLNIIKIKPFIELYVPNTPLVQEFKPLKTIAERIILEVSQEKNAEKILHWLVNHDVSLCYHSLEVMCHTMVMGHLLGYSEEYIYQLGLAALMHDIGKIFIKPSSAVHPCLDTYNYTLKIKQVPFYSATLVKKSSLATPIVLTAIIEHQENFIGTGYPFAKMRGEIHPFSMLIHLADDFDTLFTNKVKWGHKGDIDYSKAYINRMKNRRYSSSAIVVFNESMQCFRG